MVITAVSHAGNNSEGEQLQRYHREFREFDTPWIAYHLIMALNRIMEEVVCTYDTSSLNFEVRCDE